VQWQLAGDFVAFSFDQPPGMHLKFHKLIRLLRNFHFVGKYDDPTSQQRKKPSKRALEMMNDINKS
jgi:hypothetical protein